MEANVAAARTRPDRPGDARCARPPPVPAERPLAEAIAERTGLDPDRDLFPAVTAAAIAGGIRVAGRHWLEPGNDLSFATALFRALSCVFQAGEPRE
nr:hypothetical protein [Nonomuraea solani]